MNKFFKTLVSLAVSTAMLLSVSTPMVQVANAAEVTISSMKDTGGRISSSNPYGVSMDLQYINIGSDVSLCLEFNSDCHRNDVYTENEGDAYWSSLSPNIKTSVGRIMYYGYYGNDSSHRNAAYFDATQLLVWEVTGYKYHNKGTPLRTFNFVACTTTSNGNLIDTYSSSYRDDTVEAYNNIVSAVRNHYKKPAVMANRLDDAKNSPIKLTYSSTNKRYEAKITMPVSMWTDFDMTEALNSENLKSVRNSVNGQNGTYTIYTTAPFTNVKTVSAEKKSTKNTVFRELLIYTNKTAGDSGQTVARGADMDPVSGYMAFKADEMSGDLSITKTDDNGNVLSGIRFNVTGTSDSGRQVSLSGVTDAAGKLTFENIPVGKYTVTEDKSSVPAGYFTAESKTIEIKADETTKLGVINDEKKGTVKVHKTAEDDIVEGVEIRLSWIENGEEKSATKFTDADGWATFDELLVYNADMKTKIEYTAEELNTDDKYVVPEAVTITLPDNGDDRDISKTAELTNVLKKFFIEIVKTEPGTGAAIPGAVYGLYKDDVLLDEYTTDENGKIVTKDYTCDDGIYFKEITAPAGYTIDDSKHYVEANAASYTVERTKISAEVNDKPTEFSVSKQTVYGEDLEGAEMQIIDADGKIVEEWISESTPHVVSNLAAGDYTLKEAAAPDGYVIATEISFSIDNRNKVTVNGVEATAKDDQGNPTLTLIDDTTKVEISKQSVTGDGELPGAKLQVKDEEGNVVDEWISTNEPHYIEGKLIAGKTYTLHEEIAPDGYVVANDITFTVNADGTVTKVIMIDDIMTGSISVQKKTEGQLNVGGIDFVLSGVSTTGREIELTATTDENGKAVFESVPVGSYTITEDGATVPAGYLTADPVEGVEVLYAEATDVEIYNAEATGSIQVQKKTVGMTDLGGIDFVLSGVSTTGREIRMTATTDKNGLAVFKAVPVGAYTITEYGATVPTGYLTADPVEGVEVIYAEQTDIEIYNSEATGSIQVQKKTVGMTDLGGIDFVLSGTTVTGREIRMTATTDENGLAVFGNVPVGSYTITEDGATVPAGYLVADPVEGVEVINSEATDITITNEKIPDNPVTGEETPFVCTSLCILSILAIAVIGRRLKRSEDR